MLPIDRKTLFFYVIIFIVIMFLFSGVAIGLNIVFGTLVASVVLYFLYTNYCYDEDEREEIILSQNNLILPDPELARGYENVVRYLFSIQNFYSHNSSAYTEMINGFRNFFRIYEDTYIIPRYAGRNYEMMVDQKRISMNALHSILHNMQIRYHDQYTDKLERAITAIEHVLQEYLDKVEYMHKLHIHEDNYNIETKLIDKSGVLARNAYDKKDVPETYGDRFGHRENEFSYDLF